ncbi:amino acid adenylation domain-containing protein [Nocardia sp. NPDC051463]|uniref:non-ribosomal peptide synthetase n=1 Tax=Nocardia sp. NPDC051463 TaxID=3154845 RepID=UPI0034384377
MAEQSVDTTASGLLLGPIQRAYLVGDQDGLELRGPARYYLACTVDVTRVRDIQQRLDRLVRDNPVLRLRVGTDLMPTPVDADSAIPVAVLAATEATFDTIDAGVGDEFRSDTFEFDSWPQLRITVVHAARRARIHLVFALWLMDAASLNRFLEELISSDACGGVAVEVPDPLSGRRRERDEKYWRAAAPMLPEAAEAPLRPGWRQSSRAVTHRMLHIDATSAAAIAAGGRRHGLTVSTVFLTVYGALLGAVGGGAPHTVTIVQSRRDSDRAEHAIANYGSPMPLPIPARGGRSFVALGRDIQGRFLEQSLHASLSGIEIARLADPSADQRRLRYPFAFTAVELDSRREERLGLRRDWATVQLRVPQVLLDHQVVLDTDGTVRLGFDWRTDAFDDRFVEDFIDQYARAVVELAADEDAWDRPIGRVKSTTSADRLAGRVATTVHDRVLEIVARMPDAPAVRDEDGVLSYAMLAAAAAEVADRLVAAGASAGDPVAIHLPRGRGQVVAILGALLAGCLYIPLDRGLPDGRLDRIARHAQVRYAVTDGVVADQWQRRGVRPIAVPGAASNTPVRAAAQRKSPDVAYVIFTSGSTGEPKGVVISHAAVLNTIDAVNELVGLGPFDSVLSVSSIGFDLSVYDLFGPLLVGATVVMLSEDTARTPAAWSRAITEHGVTMWNSAPALAALLAEEGAVLPSLRVFLLSGDWIPLPLPAALRRMSDGSEVISLGGATEASIWSICHRIGPQDLSGRSIPYGKPLSGQDILVLDARHQVCPDWHIGEIYIAGAGVAEGYLNDMARTAAAFTDDPEHGWIYRTGDRGRRWPDGVVEFLGRVDTQVKVNGYRVELGEIESLLDATPAVRRSAACVAADGGGVIAYVTLWPDAPATWRATSTNALRAELPSYMVPYALVEVGEIPLTPNGKVDRQRLLAAAAEIGVPVAPAAVDRKGLHVQEVAACWSEVVGHVPGAAGFFESGHSSLDAIRLLSALRSRLGYEVSFGQFVANPTVTGLAGLCGTARATALSPVWSFAPRTVAGPRGRVVLFPPVGGGIACYAGLIRSLPGDLDVHVIGFDRPFEAPVDTDLTLADVAAACVRRLPAVVAESEVPCIFAGWSFGGALAVEAARSTSYPVTRVVVIDTPVSADSRRCDLSETAMLAGFVSDIRQAGGVVVNAEDVRTDPALHSRLEVYRQNMLLLAAWEPGPVAPPVVEFRSTLRPAEPEPLAWRQWSPTVRSVLLSGGHFDVFDEENARRVVNEMESGVR